MSVLSDEGRLPSRQEGGGREAGRGEDEGVEINGSHVESDFPTHSPTGSPEAAREAFDSCHVGGEPQMLQCASSATVLFIDSENDSSRLDSGSEKLSNAHVGMASTDGDDLSATERLLAEMPLLGGVNLHEYFFSAFAAVHEHTRGRDDGVFYHNRLLDGPPGVALHGLPAHPPTDEVGADGDATCDDQEESDTHDEEKSRKATTRAEATKRGPKMKSKPSASDVSASAATGGRAESTPSAPPRRGAPKAVLLDPHATSLYRHETGRDETGWVAGVGHRASGELAQQEIGGASASEPAVIATSHAFAGVAAVAGLFRTALRDVYDREDALMHALRQEEDHLMNEGLGLRKRGTHSVSGVEPRTAAPPSAAAAGKRRRSDTIAMDLFDVDCFPTTAGGSDSDTYSSSSVGLAAAAADNTSGKGPMRHRQVPFDLPAVVATPQQLAVATTVSPTTTALRHARRVTLQRQLHLRHEGRAALDRSTRLRRLQELPTLVEDAMQYALLLATLRSGGTPTAASTTANTTTASSSAAVGGSSSCASALASGESGQLLYLKYPPPLFRASSFTTETLRLLKWLRTWRQVEAPQPPVAITKEKSSPQRSNSNNTIFREESGMSAGMVNATARAAATGTVVRHMASASQQLEGCARAAMRSAASRSAVATKTLLDFFAAPAKRTTEVNVDAGDDEVVRAEPGTTGDVGEPPMVGKTVGKRGRPPTYSPSVAPNTAGTFEHTMASKETHEDGERVRKAAKTEAAPVAAPLANSIADALNRYTAQWRDALTAAASINSNDTVCRSSSNPTAASVSFADSSRTTAPRAATSLPFYDDMLKETDVLGSVAEVVYDCHGTRLRSARLAKKEAEYRQRELVQRRRREQKKGYFDRANVDGEGGGGGGSQLGRWGCRDDGNSSSSSSGGDGPESDEITNIAVVSGPTGSGKTAAVYLAAHLLHFRVVEMNASVRRSPKNVERLLAELTRSYRLSGLHMGRAHVSTEDELMKLKREHAALVAKMKAEADAAAVAAASEEAAKKANKARKTNAISAKAVAAFFGAARTHPATATAGRGRNREDEGVETTTGEEETSASTLVVVGQTSTVTASPAIVEVEDDQKPCTSAGVTNTITEPPRTLLLIEDADVLLGDESMRPLYAAIRDLATRSNVPLVVTVSTPAAAKDRRYPDRFPALPRVTHFTSASARGNETEGGPVTNSAAYVATDVYSQDPTTAIGEEVARLHEEERVADSSACQHVALNAHLAAHYFGQRTPFTRVAPLSRAALYAQLLVVAAVELGLLVRMPGAPPSSYVAGATSVASTAAPPDTIGGDGAYCRSRVRADAVAAVVPTSKTARQSKQRQLHSASKMSAKKAPLTLQRGSHGFQGRSKGCAAADGTEESSVSRCTPILTVTPSVLSSPSPGSSPSAGIGMNSLDAPTRGVNGSASSLDGSSLTIVDGDRFRRLAEVLCEEVFMTSNSTGGFSCKDGAVDPQPPCTLVALSAAKAGSLATTDVRYWLNRLQLLLLTPSNLLGVVSRNPPTGSGSVTHEDNPPVPRRMKHSAPALFNKPPALGSLTCEDLSSGDVYYGRYRNSLAHNDGHGPRQQRWLLEATVPYSEDVLLELDTLDHPTRMIDYTASMATEVPSAAVSVSGAEGAHTVDGESGAESEDDNKVEPASGRGRDEIGRGRGRSGSASAAALMSSPKTAKRCSAPPPLPPPSPTPLAVSPVNAKKSGIAAFLHTGIHANSGHHPNTTTTAAAVSSSSIASSPSGERNGASSSGPTLFLVGNDGRGGDTTVAAEEWRWPCDLILPYGTPERWLAALDGDGPYPTHEAISKGNEGRLGNSSSGMNACELPAIPSPPVPAAVRGLAAAATAPSASATASSAWPLSSSLPGAPFASHPHGGTSPVSPTPSGLGLYTGGGGGSSSGGLAAGFSGTATGSGGNSSNCTAEAGSILGYGWWPATAARTAAFKAAWRRTRRAENVKQHVVGRSAAVMEDVLGFSSLTGPMSSPAQAGTKRWTSL